MSPSVSENFKSGKRHQKSAHTRSPNVIRLIADARLIATLGGASDDDIALALRLADPTWQHSTVPSSLAAPNNRSHAPEWIVGMCNASGFSLNVTAWQPLPASRR